MKMLEKTQTLLRENKLRKFQLPTIRFLMINFLSHRASSSQLKCPFNLSIITWRERSELISEVQHRNHRSWTQRIKRIMATLNSRKILCKFYVLYISCIKYMLYWHSFFSHPYEMCWPKGLSGFHKAFLAKTHQLLMCAEKLVFS